MFNFFTSPTFTVGSFEGIPIGIGLALETIIKLDDSKFPEREIPKIDLGRYSGLVIDVFTIVRDLVNSMDRLNVKPARVAEMCVSVMDKIALLSPFDGNVRFINTHSAMAKVSFKLETKSTKKAIKLKNIDDTMRIIRRYLKLPMMHFSRPTSDVLILTHHSYWMASHSHLDISILQTHTGEVLRKNDLWKRYPKSKVFEREGVPLVKELLLLTGDGDYIKGKGSTILRNLPKWNKRTSKLKIQRICRGLLNKRI